MRRKSERTASKKTNASPEKNIDKMKKTRTRRRKQSTSSENESVDETISTIQEPDIKEAEKEKPTTPVKEVNPDASQDQVWQVKTAEGLGDTGEIQKLKICLKRPPSTPERVDRSPRSKRKHSRATSSSDTASVETGDEKKKSKHRVKRLTRESKDDVDNNHDSQGDEGEPDAEVTISTEATDTLITQSNESQPYPPDAHETPVSSTIEEEKMDTSKDSNQDNDNILVKSKVPGSEKEESQNKSSDADTTVTSPKPDTQINDCQPKGSLILKNDDQPCKSPSVEKSEVLEIHTEENKSSMEIEAGETDKVCVQEAERAAQESEEPSTGVKVSTMEDKCENKKSESTQPSRAEGSKDDVENNVVVNTENDITSATTMSTDDIDSHKEGSKKEFERSESIQSAQLTHEDTHQNGQAVLLTMSRKRRWGSRPSKVTSQKSITISTDVLKDIISDVKPVEFEEVIETKKHHKRIEVIEKVERPILPKIVIDNTESVEQLRKEKAEEKDSVKMRDSHLASNRKISIVKENDSIITRPPSPPRHKQSNILYITNLVRPFTLPQLKNLLQRTGRIKEDGFWIDKIKSKCYVKYETEDQAIETRHALHGVTWPVSNPKTLQVDFSSQEAFDKAKANEDADNAQVSTIPGTVEDWLREQDMKRERGELDKPWERKVAVREWDVGKDGKEKEKEKPRRDERLLDKRRHKTPERSPEPARKFKKKEEEAPAKLLDDLFRKTKSTPCIYWLPLSAETIAIKEEQRRQHMAEHERRLHELRRARSAHSAHSVHPAHPARPVHPAHPAHRRH